MATVTADRTASADVELVLEFEADDEARGLAVATRHVRQRTLLRFAEHLAPRGLVEASTADVGAFCEGKAKRTRQSYVGALWAFYEWARLRRLVGSNPAEPLHGREPARDHGELAELLAGFRLAQERRALAPSTINHRRWELRRLAEWMAPQSILDASAEDIERWCDARHLTPKGRYDSISTCHAFFAWAIREELVEADPTESIDRPRLPAHLPRPIDDTDLEAALAGADPERAAWYALAAFQGLRCKEIASLQREDVLLHQEPPMLLVRSPKGRRQRSVPLHPRALEAIEGAGLPRAGYVFRRNDGKPHTPARVSQLGNQALRGLGVDATMHQLRHWFGSRLYANTRDLRMTQELLGHSSPTTTAVYTAFNPGDAVGAVAGLSTGKTR